MDLTLTVQPGRTLGTRPSRRLRAEGKVPAVVYGQGREPTSVAVPWPELRKVLTTEAGMNALISLSVEGEPDTNLSIIKDLQRHPVRRDVIHVDFQLINRDEALTVEVPINLIGVAKAVETKKGTVDQLMYTLTINAKPGFIPTALEADIDDLDVGTAVHVSDITLPEGVTTDVDLDEVVVQGSQSRATIEEEAAEGEEGEEGTEGEGGEAASEGEGGGSEG
ncbi:MAG: 50S ribosomal protein L25 [Actinobacteria bacterium]|nr:50S ribosomal protein L25 [Actinomycetota bacterium]